MLSRKKHKIYVFILNDEETVLVQKSFDVNLFRYSKKPLKIKHLLFEAKRQQIKIDTKRSITKSIINKDYEKNSSSKTKNS